jgi:DNA-binding NtrC family response regulator
MPNILIADDQSDVVEALRLLLKMEGYKVDSVASPAEALILLQRKEFDVALIDLNYSRDTTSGAEGLDLLDKIQKAENAPSVVVMTAWGSVELAVEAMRRGARDFIQKPWDNARLVNIIRTQLELSASLKKGRRLEAENRMLRDEPPPVMIADSEAMRPVMEVIRRVGPADANVLVTGENGTGKGVVARMLHAHSPRAERPLVSVNVPGLSEGVFESELFGHVRGAFTDAKTDRIGRFELSDQGTLFLDEIAHIPPGLQAKLLRVLETGEYERVGSSKTLKSNARIVSATNADLHADIAAGRFRQDLLFRLNTVEIQLPPLRDRRDDIARLATYFLNRTATRYRRTFDGFEPDAIAAMERYPWPGNVRELEHCVERAVLMANGSTVRAADLLLTGTAAPAAPNLDDLSMDEVEQLLVKKALARFGGNVSKAAEALGLSRSAMYRRLEKFGL